MSTSTQFLSSFRRTLTIVGLMVGLLLSSRASAAVYTWTGSASGTSAVWNSGSNWSGNAYPTTGNSLVFNNSTKTNPNQNNIGGLALPSISFVSGAGAFTISGSAINIGSITNTSANTQTLGLGVIQSTSGTYDATSNITLSGALSGSGNILKTGASTLALNGSKANYTGTVTVNAGTLAFGSSMSNGNVNMQANTRLDNTSGGDLTLKSLEISGTNVTLPSSNLGFLINGGALTNSTGSQLTINNNMTFSKNSTINAGADGMTLNGVVAGSGTTTSVGTGLLDMTNSGNGHSGVFIVQTGSTRLSSGFGADFIVKSGAVLESTSGGNGTVKTVTMENGGILLPGGPDSIGRISASTDVTLAPSSIVGFDIGGSNPAERGVPGVDFDQVKFASGGDTGVLTYNGFVNLNFTTSTTFDNGVSFLLFNNSDTGTYDAASNLAGFNTTTTTGSSSYGGLTFTNYASTTEFERSYFNLVEGDWISSWNGDGHQRLIFSQSTGTLTVVPEPSTIVFAGIGMAMASWSTWTRRRAKARQQVIEASIA